MQNIRLRQMTDLYKAEYLKLQKELAYNKDVFNNEKYVEDLWKNFWEKKRVVYSISTELEGDFCGYCAVKNINAECPEIEIELVGKYRRKGIGYQALSLMLQDIYERYDKQCFFSRVEPDNYASQNLMKKIGGKPAGIMLDSMFLEEEQEEFEKRHSNLLDKYLEKVAEEFQVEPEKLLSHVLCFHITVDDMHKAIVDANEKEKEKSNKTYRMSGRKLYKAKYNYVLRRHCKVLEDIKDILESEQAREKADEYLQAELEKISKLLDGTM